MAIQLEHASVDWRTVDAQLASVSEEYKDPKFYALKHVVEILTSNNPQAMVAQLRDQEQRLAVLVDNMVQGYHSGFAKSIQNYSQILQLFGDAKEQVDGLKKSLADGSRQLSAQSRTLHQQWRRSLTLEASLKLLDDIQLVADAPARIEAALAAKAWSKAVDLLLEACNRLSREEMTKVGSLRQLRDDLLATSDAIQEQLLGELQNRVYTSSSSSAQQQQQQYGSDQQQYVTAASGGMSRSVFDNKRSMQQSLARSPPLNLGRSSLGSGSPRSAAAAAAAAAGRDGSSNTSVMPSFVSDALSMDLKSGSSSSRQYGSSSGGSSGGIFGGSSAAAAAATNVAELVGCLVQMDALADAKAYFFINARSGVRKMIMQVVETWAAAQEQQQQQQQPSRATGGSGSSSSMIYNTRSSTSKQPAAATVPVQQAVQKLLQSVFDSCLKALVNLGLLLQEITAAHAAAAAAGSSAMKAPQPAAAAARRRGAAAAATASTLPANTTSTAGLQQLWQQTAAAAGSSSPKPDGSGSSSRSSPSRVPDQHTLARCSPDISGANSGLSFVGRQGSSSTAAAGGSSSSGLATQAVRSGYTPHGNLQGLKWLRSSGLLNPDNPEEYIKSQYGQVWHEFQEECLLLLSELLGTNLRSPAAAAAAAAAAGSKQAGWLSEFADIGDRAKSQILQATGAGSSSSSTAATGVAAAAVASPQGPRISGSAGSFSSPGSNMSNPTGYDTSQGSKLTFNFEITAAGLLPAAAAADQNTGVTSGPRRDIGSSGTSGVSGAGVTGGPRMLGDKAVGYASLLSRGMSASTAGPYLTPTVYLAVSNFVSDALIVIADASSSVLTVSQPPGSADPAAAAAGSSTRPSTPPPTTPSIPSRNYSASPLGKSSVSSLDRGSSQQQQQQQQGSATQVMQDSRLMSVWLKQSVEDYVMQGFLPQVWVDLRGRCTAALEDPEAFRPQITANLTNNMLDRNSVTSRQWAGISPCPRELGFSGSSSSSLGYLTAAAAGSSSSSAIKQLPRSAVAAAGFAITVLSEVMAWLPAVPAVAAATLAGVLDSILSYVLKALAWQASKNLAGHKSGTLTLNPVLSLVMATEPDAVLLSPENATPFYVPLTAAAGSHGSAAAAAAGSSGASAGNLGSSSSSSGDPGFAVWAQPGGYDLESFTRALKSEDKPVLVPGFHRPSLKLRGLGLEGESAATEVLLYCTRERPPSIHQLLSATKPSGLVMLVSLGESCEWIAENLEKWAATAAAVTGPTGRSSSPISKRSSSPVKGGRGSPKRGAAAAAAAGSSDGAAAVAATLHQLADGYRSLSGACLRAVRLDLQLLTAATLHELAAASHICDEDDVTEAQPCIGALIRLTSRAAEELTPHLSARKLNYVFGAIPGAAATNVIWMLQAITEINANGVERMIRSLALMQGPLSSLGTPAGGGAEINRAYDRAKSYYTLIGLPADEVVRLAADKPGRFTLAEWQALLQVHVPGRTCEEKHIAALYRALDKYYHLSAGQKMADFFEGVGRSVQEPVVKIGTGVTAGFKGGFVQVKGLLNKAAEAVQEAAAATATSVGAIAAKQRSTGGGGEKE